MTILREHRRSVAFLQSQGDAWACFLVTVPAGDGSWRGYFSFRPSHGDVDEDEVRTTEIFIEGSEAEILCRLNQVTPFPETAQLTLFGLPPGCPSPPHPSESVPRRR